MRVSWHESYESYQYHHPNAQRNHSLEILLRVSETPPDGLIVDTKTCPLKHIAKMGKLVRSVTQRPFEVYITEQKSLESKVAKPSGVFSLARPDQKIELVSSIAKVAQKWKVKDQSKANLDKLSFEDLIFDPANLEFVVLPDRIKLDLSLKETLLLQLFIREPKVWFSKEHIIDSVWKGVRVSVSTLNSHISRLRSKLEAVAGLTIANRYRQGYCLTGIHD